MDVQRLAAATNPHITVFEASTGALRDRVAVDRHIRGLDWSPDGSRPDLAIDHGQSGDLHFSGSARVLDIATGSNAAG